MEKSKYKDPQNAGSPKNQSEKQVADKAKKASYQDIRTYQKSASLSFEL